MSFSENGFTLFEDHARMRAIDGSHAMYAWLDRKTENRFSETARKKRAQHARVNNNSTTNVMLFEQGLVTRLVLPLDVIEQRTARRDHFQQAAARMIVLHVALEVVGEVVDAFRQDRDLNLGRAGVAGLVGIGLDDLCFALRGNRHRQTFSLRP